MRGPQTQARARCSGGSGHRQRLRGRASGVGSGSFCTCRRCHPVSGVLASAQQRRRGRATRTRHPVPRPQTRGTQQGACRCNVAGVLAKQPIVSLPTAAHDEAEASRSWHAGGWRSPSAHVSRRPRDAREELGVLRGRTLRRRRSPSSLRRLVSRNARPRRAHRPLPPGHAPTRGTEPALQQRVYQRFRRDGVAATVRSHAIAPGVRSLMQRGHGRGLKGSPVRTDPHPAPA